MLKIFLQSVHGFILPFNRYTNCTIHKRILNSLPGPFTFLSITCYHLTRSLIFFSVFKIFRFNFFCISFCCILFAGTGWFIPFFPFICRWNYFRTQFSTLFITKPILNVVLHTKYVCKKKTKLYTRTGGMHTQPSDNKGWQCEKICDFPIFSIFSFRCVWTIDTWRNIIQFLIAGDS